MSPSRLFILRPVATSLLMAAILLTGLVAYTQLPMAALPQVDYPTIQVVTFYPGASAEVTSTTVTAPLERQFGQIPSLRQMTSTSGDGVSVVVLQFLLDRDIDAAQQDVQASINTVNRLLPPDLPMPPIYSKTNPADPPVMTLAFTSRTIPLPKVQDLIDTRVVPKLSQLSGVGPSPDQRRPETSRADPGERDRAVVVRHRSRVAAHGADPDQRQCRQGQLRWATSGVPNRCERSAQHQRRVQGRRRRVPQRLAGHAVQGRQRHRRRRGRAARGVDERGARGHRQRAASTGRQHDYRVDSIRALLPRLRETLPADIQVTVLTDLATGIEASVREVEHDLLISLVLVVVVIFVFLRSLRATVIPSVAVPLSVIGTFGVMYLLRWKPRQPVADGADDRDRLRGRRRDRDDRERLAVRRGVSRRAKLRSRVRHRSASRSCR